MSNKILELCKKKNIPLTKNRQIIAETLSKSNDHPNVEELFNRVSKIKPSIGIATVYRTIKMLEEEGIIIKHDFGQGKARYEQLDDNDHHDHLINIENNQVIEFFNQEIEDLKDKIAKELGYKLIDHRLELYGVPLKKDKNDS